LPNTETYSTTAVLFNLLKDRPHTCSTRNSFAQPTGVAEE